MGPAYCAKSASRGFSIIELLVATALTAMLLGGVIAIFLSSRSSFAATDRLSQIQENGRYALDELVRGIRSAGFAGCARAPMHVSSSLSGADDLWWDFLGGAVMGYQFIDAVRWSPALDASNTPYSIAGSDVLLLRRPRSDAGSLRLQNGMKTDVDALVVQRSKNSELNAGDVAMVYTCEAQAYFFVSSLVDGIITHAVAPSGEKPGNAVDSLGYAFGRNAEVVPVETVLYYIGASPSDTARVPSLWRRIGTDAPQEVAPGVEQMQLQFGIDLNDDSVVDDYVTADAVTNWDKIYSVAIALLVRSLETTGPDAERVSLQLLDVAVPASRDPHMRETFTAVAGIRNRASVN